MKKEITADSEETMRQIGAKLASCFKGGEIIGLSGPLGAGKTTLAQGMLQYFGVKSAASPTYVIDSVYEVGTGGEAKLREIHHVDLYRLDDRSELLTIGFYEQLGRPEFVYVIEWFSRFPNLTDKGKLYIEINETGDKQTRNLTLVADDEKHAKLLEKFSADNLKR